MSLGAPLGYYDGSYTREILGLPATGVDPVITGLTPSTGSAAAGPIAVQVDGTGFESGSVVEVNQAAKATTFVSSTRLTTSFDPTAAGTVQFTVRNPNEEESNSFPFTVAALRVAPGDSFPDAHSIVGRTDKQADKIGGLGYTPVPDTEWDGAQSASFNDYPFRWNGERWVPSE